jgi:hypothetical protein
MRNSTLLTVWCVLSLVAPYEAVNTVRIYHFVVVVLVICYYSFAVSFSSSFSFDMLAVRIPNALSSCVCVCAYVGILISCKLLRSGW